MKLTCTFAEFTFNTGKKFYQCIIRDQKIPQNENLEFFGQHLSKRCDIDVQFVEFRDCNCPKIPQGLTKTFPNLMVLGICNSKLKELTKDDMAEYKNLKKFICHKNDIDFLPGDLFEEFRNLGYIKFTFNKLGIIEPNLLDNIEGYPLYINFKSNPDIHLFSGSFPYERSVNALPGMITVTFYENFLNSDVKFIRNYIFKSPYPRQRLDYLKLYANNYKSKLNILLMKHDFYGMDRANDIEGIAMENQILKEKVDDLEVINKNSKAEMVDLEDSQCKMIQQIEECNKDLQKMKEENVKLNEDLQSQIDNLVLQFQSIMFDRK